MRSRGEGRNEISTNGECLVQRAFLARHVQKNERATVFDVGANIGQWTMSLIEEARRSSTLHLMDIHVFEPVEATFRVLDERCSREALHCRVWRVQRAVSRSDGTADMHIVGPTSGTNSLHRDLLAPKASTIQVRTCSIDSYCRENGVADVGLLKCDTEGHDFEVLLGATEMFDRESIGLCQFEYNHRWINSRHYLKDVFDFAYGRPYLVGKVTRSGIEIIRSWHPELERFFETNYVLVHKEALRNYPHRIVELDISNTYA
jgi:FkbM family methyltransferase